MKKTIAGICIATCALFLAFLIVIFQQKQHDSKMNLQLNSNAFSVQTNVSVNESKDIDYDSKKICVNSVSIFDITLRKYDNKLVCVKARITKENLHGIGDYIALFHPTENYNFDPKWGMPSELTGDTKSYLFSHPEWFDGSTEIIVIGENIRKDVYGGGWLNNVFEIYSIEKVQ